VSDRAQVRTSKLEEEWANINTNWQVEGKKAEPNLEREGSCIWKQAEGVPARL